MGMIYLVGGAPRAGKSILAQQFAAKLKIGWISTDLLQDLLRVRDDNASMEAWDATTGAIVANAERFFPYLERFVWGVSSLAESYVIEGVGFLPAQVVQLSMEYEIRPVFLGCCAMTLARFDQFPGRSPGYASLPEETRRQIVSDIPRWSEFVRQEAQEFSYPYVDMSDDFPARLTEAEAILMAAPFA
jgi:2-phosphoglycerate kinase